MNLNTKLFFSHLNFILGLFILDRAWLMVLDAMILISHKNEPKKAYLPGSKDTVISKAVPSGRDSTIALRWRWSLRFPQMWETREHNLWELGTAFALSPQSKPGLCLFLSFVLHCLICILQSSLKTISSSFHRILAVVVTNLSFSILVLSFIFEPIFQNKQSNNSDSFCCW